MNAERFCGELADECMTGRSSPLAAFMVIDPSVVKVFGVNDDDVDWAAYGREAFLQNWRKRAERAEGEVERLQSRWDDLTVSLRAVVCDCQTTDPDPTVNDD